MIVFPIAKINLGLNVVERRPDGYHNLETVFFPVELKDALEVQEMNEAFPSPFDCDLKVTNIHIDGDEQRNLVVRAYNLLKMNHKETPMQECAESLAKRTFLGGVMGQESFMLTMWLRSRKLKVGMTLPSNRKAAAAMMNITAAATILIGRWFFNRTVLTWRPAR